MSVELTQWLVVLGASLGFALVAAWLNKQQEQGPGLPVTYVATLAALILAAYSLVQIVRVAS